MEPKQKEIPFPYASGFLGNLPLARRKFLVLSPIKIKEQGITDGESLLSISLPPLVGLSAETGRMLFAFF